MLVRYLLTLSLCIIASLAAQADHSIKAAYGKLSLIDFGSVIKNEPLVLDDSLIRVYELSGLDNENDKSIIAIQGLKSSGATDLTVRTNAGIYQFHVTLNSNQSEDFILDPNNSRLKVFPNSFPLESSRMTLISSPSYINEYVLVGDPRLVSLEQVVSDDDPEFLKTFALLTSKNKGNTDAVVATKTGVYKFNLDIGALKDHTENISLYLR